MAYEIEVYETDLGKKPFDDWLKELSDAQARHIIRARLVRARAGNLGNCKTLGNGINEMKIDFGPGYRIYFAKTGKALVLLMCGGSKRTQAKDIQKAVAYLSDYKKRGTKKYAKK